MSELNAFPVSSQVQVNSDLELFLFVLSSNAPPDAEHVERVDLEADISL